MNFIFTSKYKKDMRLIILLVMLIFSVSCSQTKPKVIVDFSETTSESDTSLNKEQKQVYIAIASMTSPKETFKYYNDLVNYISDKVGYPIHIKQKKTYSEVNELLENSEVDFAFICSGAFVDQYDKGSIQLLVAPEINQKTNYNAYIITQKDGPISEFKDFEHKNFAFTDPLSNTGRLYPLKKVIELGESEKTFFEKSIFTYGHDISIQMVNRGLVDGASVHGLVYNYIANKHPEKVANIKIIVKSEQFGIPPVVSPSSLDQVVFNKYKDVFLQLHTDSLGKAILNNLMIDRFVEVKDSIYSNVFELKSYIEDEASK